MELTNSEAGWEATGTKLSNPSEGPWGLLDTQDNVWMGDDAGPKIYTEYLLARVAAQMMDEQLGQKPGRTRALPYKGGATRLRDKVKTRMGALQALRNLEGGKDGAKPLKDQENTPVK